jgi:uncharacterized protein YndB with AHSA1/START domain
MEKKIIEKKAEKVLVIKRLINASPESVFRAWINKKDFISWFGPEGFTVPFCNMDARVGGEWRAYMKSPEGDEYWVEGKYLEITPPEKLVFTYADGSHDGREIHNTVVTITFTKIGNKTEMNFHQAPFPDVDSRDAHNGGWSSAFECLEEYLSKNS